MSKTHRRRKRIGIHAAAVAALLLALVISSCEAPSFLQADLPNDGPSVVTSFSAAQRLVEKMSRAAEQAANTGEVNITVTQEEVTSLLSIGSKVSEQFRAHDVASLKELESIRQATNAPGLEDLPAWMELLQGNDGRSQPGLSELSLRLAIAEPEVYFKGNGNAAGHIIVRGYGRLLVLRQPLRLVLAPRASDGELVLDFVEGNLGPVGVPEAIVDQIGRGLASAIMAGEEYVTINRIQVNEGKLTVVGRYRR